MNLSDYLTFIRSRTLPTYAPPAASEGPFGTRSSVTTDPGGSSQTGTAALPGTGDVSLGGRLALNADMNVNNVSAAKAALGLVGLLSGPLGGIAAKAATIGINMNNQSNINAALSKAGFKVGESPPELVAEFLNQTMQANPQGQPGFTEGGPHPAFGFQGFNPPSQTPAPRGSDQDAEGTPAGPPGITGPPGLDDGGMGGVPSGPAGPGPGPGEPGGEGPYHQGGIVQDRQPGLSERITAQQGEFVVKAERAAKFGPLLEAINQGKPQQIKRALKEALTA